MRPKLTIGMACFEDFHGVYFTIQALRLYHDVSQCEFIVVDNSPGTAHGEAVRKFIETWCHHGNMGIRYIPMPESQGTTQPRQRIFDEARGESVLCVDSHVLIPLGVIQRLIAFYDANSDCKDILSGPMLYDDLVTFETELKDEWRDTMHGTWFCDERGKLVDNLPYEIWGQGLGMFSCRRDAWLGFNKYFRSFGGEEGYIHEKFRQFGRKALCLPFMRWLHRYPRPDGVPYNIPLYDKIRNYILGHQELGLSIDNCFDHFVPTNLMTIAEWDRFAADPINHTIEAENKYIASLSANRAYVGEE